jgi:hypothetical protein
MIAANSRQRDTHVPAPIRLEPRSLTNGHAAPILVADFQPFSATARLSDLMCGDARDHPIYQIDPLSDLSQRCAYLPLIQIADEYADAFQAAEPAGSELYVVGYCSAATLALHIARLLAVPRNVATILVRPAWPDTALVQSQFAEFRADLGGARQGCPDLDCDPSQVIAEMEEVLRADLAALATTRGLGRTNPALTELLERYRAWLAFLLATRNGLPLPWALQERVMVLTGTAEPVTIPWGGASTCEITRLRSLNAEPFVSSELVDAVLMLAAGRGQ